MNFLKQHFDIMFFAVIMILAFGCARFTGLARSATLQLTPEQITARKCFPGYMIGAFDQGLVEIDKKVFDHISNPFTGEEFDCPQAHVTSKGIELLKKRINDAQPKSSGDGK